LAGKAVLLLEVYTFQQYATAASKEVNTEAAEKLDAILRFAKQPGNSSDACGRLPLKSKKKGLQMNCNPWS